MMEDKEIDQYLNELAKVTRCAVQTWLKKANGVPNFRDFWRIWAPKAFYPDDATTGLESTGKHNIADPVLFNTLEQYICGGDKEHFFKHLSECDNPPTLCRKFFKIEDPIYNCRECGMNSSCVLCVNCFKRSTHKNHKYKMKISDGRGCCDCGDVEAWKTEPYCETHIAGVNKVDNESLQFPPDLVKRTEVVFTAVLQYCYEILTLDHTPGLPTNLKLKDGEDLDFTETERYCMVLYNDETYTFEEVTNTLASVIKCSQRDAIDFAHNIGREERVVVSCSTFQHCTELKADIEKFTSRHGTRPLKVLVVHSHVIAHQMFAMRLLMWLQKLTTMSKGFRLIFNDVALNMKPIDTNSETASLSTQLSSVVEGILLRDSLSWKSARLHWHRLFISSMFTEYESKKAFAKVFTRRYEAVLKDFIRDDHYHPFSIAFCSIHIFTGPTLAQYLIAHEDVLFILLNTFISECSRKCNKAGKLEFDRATPSGPFERAFYILYDLQCLLSSPPEIWTDELRKGFLQGVSLILNLLTYMQGMDSVTRQVGQHMEYDPKWESAFNLHIQLAPVITLILRWCATDQKVLVKAYQLTLKKLYENPCFDPNQLGEVKALADHSALCHLYDVSTQPVSIHLPLSRFLAGLYLHLEKYGLSYYFPDFTSLKKQDPVQIIEPVLRTQVMIAQVHAGMWRSNEYSLSNQIYFYHNVKYRGEMLDKDIVILQIGASLIESNEFLIHILNKFGLLHWATPEYESVIKNPEKDGIKQTVNMVEEFLSLLITIIGERYVPGVGNVTVDDCIKNEIIHQLFIKPLSHSELNETLPDDVNHETGMEKVIEEVATFKKPSQGGKGVYEVKKDFIDKYNVFFYHYTMEELSKSEEEQRKQRKSLNGFECCPPPVLPKLTQSFSLVANLLQCDVMLHLINTVLERSLNLRARSFSEAQLHKILHLIGYALLEEEQQNYSFMNFCARADKYNIEYYLEELGKSPRVEAHKDLIQWTLRKYRAVARPNKGDNCSSSPQYMQVDDDQNEKMLRAKLAAEKRAAIMANMLALQQNFIKENAAHFQNCSSSVSERRDNIGATETELMVDNDTISPIALGQNQSPRTVCERTFTCILCKEDQVITPKGSAMVLTAFVQKSTVLVRARGKLPPCDKILNSNMGPAAHVSTCGHVMHSSCWKKYMDTILSKENSRPYTQRQPTSFVIERNEYLCPLCECINNTVLPVMSPLASICSKTINNIDALSFNSWYDASMLGIKQDPKTSPSASKESEKKHPHSEPEEDSMKDESENSAQLDATENVSFGFEFVQADDDENEDPTPFIAEQEEIFPITDREGVVQNRVSIKVFCRPSYDDQGENQAGSDSRTDCLLSDDLIEMINLFTGVAMENGLERMVVPNLDSHLTTWRACAYTIHSLEWLLRYTNKPLLDDFTSRQKDGLENLIRLSCSLGVIQKEKHSINRLGIELISMLFSYSTFAQSVLSWDCFGFLVALTVSVPSIYCADPVPPVPLGTTLEMHLFRMVLFSHFAQTIICTDLSQHLLLEKDITSEDTACLAPIVRYFKDCKGINTIAVWDALKQLSRSFLRCCAIFYHFLTGVAAPPVLKEVGGDSFENIMSYLGMPTNCNELLSGKCVLEIFGKWASHPDVKSKWQHQTIQNMIPLNELVELPKDYSELINRVPLFTCPCSDREDYRILFMCLVCGAWLCTYCRNFRYCTDTSNIFFNNNLANGYAYYYCYYCDTKPGIFLCVKECQILLFVSREQFCFIDAPYLDDYGEADPELRRGNKLTLCKEPYRKLQLLWLSHSIQEQVASLINRIEE